MFIESERVELKEIYIPEIKKEVIAFVHTDGDSFESRRSLEQDLQFTAFAAEMQLRNLEYGEVQQKNLGILTTDDMYTNLGLLVSDACKHSIKVAVFQGTDKSVFRDRYEFGGSVFQQLKDAYKSIDFYNATKANFQELLRVDCRDYPTEAIREALLNAIIHRDYSFSGSIAINIYSDKIEIISLGGLVSGLSLEAIMMGASQPRNEKLAGLFYRLKLIESYGIGIGKIMSAYRDYDVKPTFDTVQGAFRVTLPNINHLTTTGINTMHSKVIAYLQEHGQITRADVEQLLTVKLTRANAVLKEMQALGYIVKAGSGRNTKYVLCDSPLFSLTPL